MYLSIFSIILYFIKLLDSSSVKFSKKMMAKFILITLAVFLIPSTVQFMYSDTLDVYKSIIINIDFNPVIVNRDNCSITVKARAATSKEEKDFETIVNTSCKALSLSKQTYQLWNFQLHQILYRVQIVFVQNISYYQSLYATQLYFKIKKMSNFQAHSGQSRRYFTTVLLKDQISSSSLPFNLISTKSIKVFVNHLNKKQLTQTSYNIVPFLQTYWNQIDASQILTPWLPYFSNCQNFAPRIFLHDIFVPSKCQFSRNEMGLKQILCQQQNFRFQCVLQQLNVQKFQKQYWWNTKNHLLYHFFPKQLNAEQLQQYLTSNTLQSALTSETFKKMIPILYENKVGYQSPKGNPNRFTIEFYLLVNADQSLEIVSAKMIASYKASQSLPQKHAELLIKVSYPRFWDRINGFHEGLICYIILSLGFSLSLIFLIHVSLTFYGVKLKILQKFKLIIFPVIKGFFYMLIVGLIFVIVFYFISKGTQFSLIATSFNGNPTVGLDQNYNGRSGLMLAFTGVFLLISAINQSFKIPSIQETHLLVHDDIDDKQSAINHVLNNKRNSNRSSQIVQERKQMANQNLDLQQNPNRIAQKEKFIIKNLQSQRKCLFLYLLTIQAVLLYCFFNFVQFESSRLDLTILLGYPLGQKLIIMMYRHFIIKQYLYLHGTIIVYETFFSLFLFKSKTVSQILLNYFLKIIADVVIQPFYQFFCEFLIIKLNDKPDRNFITLRIWLAFRDIIKQIAGQSQYEKSIFYSGLITSKICTSYFKPIFILLLYVTLEESKLYNQLYFIEKQFITISVMMVAMIPLENYIVLVSARILETKFKLKISQSIDFNNFKFSIKKIKWLNDSFKLNRNICNFYRQFEKFSFSSQLYLISFLLVLALTCILIGSITIIQTSYIIYNDPVLLVIILAVLLTGIILSFVLSFIVIKLRLYEKKQEVKIRTKLQNNQKLLKKKDYSEYLQLDSVKNHFMMFNMKWIVSNLTSILNKEDFEQNNCDLLVKYKYYKSIAKKKQLQAKKHKQNLERNQNQQDHQAQLKQIQAHPRNQQGILVPIPRKSFEKYAKPIIYSWFYLAKQNLYLKSLVKLLRQEKLRPNCQFCNMDIELQVVQKKPFTQIINEFRVTNVGRMFNETVFVNYYREHQQFITVCIQCKDKKCHLQKKTIKNAKGIAGKLILRWLMIARTKKLHTSYKGYKKAVLPFQR